jgi:hypothetical protein
LSLLKLWDTEPFSKKLVKEAWAMYKNGDSMIGIANKLKTTRSILETRFKESYLDEYAVLRSQKLEPKHLAEKQYGSLSDEVVEKIIDMFESGGSVKQIARLLNLKQAVITKVLNEKMVRTMFNLVNLENFGDPSDHEVEDEMNRFL